MENIIKKCTKCLELKELNLFHKDVKKRDGLCSHCKECKIKAVKLYLTENKEKCKERNNIHYQKNRSEINKKRRKYKNIEGRGNCNKENPSCFDFGSSLRKRDGESSFYRLVRQYKANAKKRGIFFGLSDDELRKITESFCFYCGVEPLQKMQSSDSNGFYIYNGIDRVNSQIGYIATNCVPACKICNRAKSNMPEQEWNSWIRRIVVFHTAGNVGFKKTLEKDELPKSVAKKQAV